MSRKHWSGRTWWHSVALGGETAWASHMPGVAGSSPASSTTSGAGVLDTPRLRVSKNVRGGRPRVERKRLDLSPRGAQRVEQLTSHVAEGDPPLEVFGS